MILSDYWTVFELKFEILGIKVSPEELTAMIREVDKDQSGSIEEDEFLTLMQERYAKQKVSYDQIFKHFDQNKNGFIEFDDLRKSMELQSGK